MGLSRTLITLIAVATCAAAACQRTTSPVAPAPNVVLLVMDTVRADRLSTYGYPLPTAPTLDALAREAIRFENAYSTSSWTLPAHASLFTGLFPDVHGANQEHWRLDDRFTTLAELLADKGYATAAFSANPWVAYRTGLMQGFQHVREMWRREEQPRAATGHPTNARVREWLADTDLDRPFLLFVNYMEAHYPYDPAEPYRSRFVPTGVPAELRAEAEIRWTEWYLQRPAMSPVAQHFRGALYDAEVNAVDAAVGELLAILKQRGVYDTSLIVVTADHGENLGDHGHLDHVFSLYNTTMRVPLLIRPPGAAPPPAVRTDPVQLTDLFATVVAAAGAEPLPSPPRAVDLLATVVPPDRPVLAEYDYPRQALDVFPVASRDAPALAPFKRQLRSLQVRNQKLIWASDGRHELYEMDRGDDEVDNLIGSQADVAQRLESQLHSLTTAQAGEPPLNDAPHPDPATEERLRALGYAH